MTVTDLRVGSVVSLRPVSDPTRSAVIVLPPLVGQTRSTGVTITTRATAAGVKDVTATPSVPVVVLASFSLAAELRSVRDRFTGREPWSGLPPRAV